MSTMTEVQHFTHIHPLTKVDECGDFMCDGCKTNGSGKTYLCTLCDYNLHDHCATSPHNLLSYMHPEHELRIVFKGPEQTQQDKRMCDICDESVEGLLYQCEPCGFDVHPLCTKLPQNLKHAVHPEHPLEFCLGGESECMDCHGPCKSWRYRCELCSFDIHLKCILPDQGTNTRGGLGRIVSSIARFLSEMFGGDQGQGE